MRRKELFLISAILILAALWRVVCFWQIKNDFIFLLLPGSDSLNYHNWAKTILEQGVFYKPTFYGLPLYTSFLSFIYKIFSTNLWAVRIIQLLMGVINCLLIYLIAKRLFNLKVAVSASILLAFYTMFIFYEVLLMPTTLIIFLNSLLILSFFEVQDSPAKKNFFLLGILLGVISLAEPGIILFAISLIIRFFFSFNNQSKKQLAVYNFILIMGILLVLSLSSLRNYIARKDLVVVSSHSGINFYIGNNPYASGVATMPPFLRPTQRGHLEDARIISQKVMQRKLKPSEVSNFWFLRAGDFITDQPLAYLKLLLRKLIIFWQRFEPIDTVEFTFLEGNKFFLFLLLNSFGLIAPLGLLGIILTLKQYRNLFILYLFILTQIASIVLFFITTRYRLVVVPFIIIFSAYSLYWFYLKFKEKQIKNFIYGVFTFTALFGLINYRNPTYQTLSFNLPFDKHYTSGVLKAQKGNLEQAIKELKTAIELVPSEPMPHFALANVYRAIGQIDLAIQEYKTTLLLNANFIDAHFNLGFLYQERGKLSEAEKEYQQVLNLEPESLDAHYKLATLYQSLGRLSQAIEHFQKILEYNPYYSSAIKPLIEECLRLKSAH